MGLLLESFEYHVAYEKTLTRPSLFLIHRIFTELHWSFVGSSLSYHCNPIRPLIKSWRLCSAVLIRLTVVLQRGENGGGTSCRRRAKMPVLLRLFLVAIKLSRDLKGLRRPRYHECTINSERCRNVVLLLAVPTALFG